MHVCFWGWSLWVIGAKILPEVRSIESQYEVLSGVWREDKYGGEVDLKIPATLDILSSMSFGLQNLLETAEWARYTAMVNFPISPFYFPINNEFYALHSLSDDLKNQFHLITETIPVTRSILATHFELIEEDETQIENLKFVAGELYVDLGALVENIESIKTSGIQIFSSYSRSSTVLGLAFSKAGLETYQKDFMEGLEIFIDGLKSYQVLMGLLDLYSSITNTFETENRIYNSDIEKANSLFKDLIQSSSGVSRDSVSLNNEQMIYLSPERIQLIETASSLLWELSMFGYLSTEVLMEGFEKRKNQSMKNDSQAADASLVLDYLSKVNYISEPLVLHLRNASSLLSQIVDDSQWSNQNFQNPDLKNAIQYVDNFELIIQSIPVIKYLLEDEIKRYILLSHSSDELRPTGGFVSGLWLLTVRSGQIDELKYYDIVDVDDFSKVHTYPQVPDLLKTYMGANVWLMRDVSWGPDIETTALAAQRMFKISTGIEVDGVIGINPRVLLNIAEFLGEIDVSPESDIKVDSKELISYIERRSDEDGRIFADVLFRSLLNQLNENKEISQMISLVDSMKSSIDSNDLWIYFLDSQIQAHVEELDLYPVLWRDGGDYLFFIDSNVGWSKSDPNISRKFSYKVDLSDVNDPRAVLEITYKNYSGYSAAGCEPQWVDRGDTYAQLKNACYWNLMRIYTPSGIALQRASKFELPAQSIPVEKWGQMPMSDTFRTGRFNDRLNQIIGLIVLAPGQSVTKTISYELPSDVISYVDNCLSYNLKVKKQPGVATRNSEIAIILPQSTVLYDLSSNAEFVGGQIQLVDSLNSDIDLKLMFSLGPNSTCGIK